MLNTSISFTIAALCATVACKQVVNDGVSGAALDK